MLGVSSDNIGLEQRLEVGHKQITPEALAEAIVDKTHKKVSYDKALEVGWRVMHFFGFQDYVLDRVLGSKLCSFRKDFYFLEDLGLAGTGKWEGEVSKECVWRTHYWYLKKDRILYDSSEKVEAEKENPYDVYNELPEDAWRRD